jgi:hypothetical protein
MARAGASEQRHQTQPQVATAMAPTMSWINMAAVALDVAWVTAT